MRIHHQSRSRSRMVNSASLTRCRGARRSTGLTPASPRGAGHLWRPPEALEHVLARWVASVTGPSLRTVRTADPSPFVTLTVTTSPARPCRGRCRRGLRRARRWSNSRVTAQRASSTPARTSPTATPGSTATTTIASATATPRSTTTGPRVTAAASGTAGGVCASEQQRSTVGATVPRPCARAWPAQRRSHRQRPRAWSQTAAA